MAGEEKVLETEKSRYGSRWGKNAPARWCLALSATAAAREADLRSPGEGGVWVSPPTPPWVVILNEDRH